MPTAAERALAALRSHPWSSPGVAARAQRRRVRRVAAADNDLTAAEWASILAGWEGCCYCGATGVPLQRDCVLPISRGGRYTLENVVPACRSCNASKSNDEVTSWMRRRRLDEPAFLVRWATAVRALPQQ